MFRKVLSYLIVVLIAMQSVAAIADTYQSHPSDTHGDTHENFHNSNVTDNIVLFDKSTDAPIITQSDCHHCCHSHVMAYLKFTIGNSIFTQFKHKLSEYKPSIHSLILPPDIRPPIA